MKLRQGSIWVMPEEAAKVHAPAQPAPSVPEPEAPESGAEPTESEPAEDETGTAPALALAELEALQARARLQAMLSARKVSRHGR